jgi:hypothetical protein
MDKLYYYIALAVIYYGYQAYKKYKENEAKQAKSMEGKQKPVVSEFKGQEPVKKPLESRPKPKPLVSNPKSTRPAPMYIPGKTPPLSLEELLKQFDKTGTEPVKKDVENYEDKPVQKSYLPVDKYVDEEVIAQEKVKADERAALEMKNRPPLKEAAFTPYQEEAEKESEYIKLLKSPDGAKKAFVMSEIFNRKF